MTEQRKTRVVIQWTATAKECLRSLPLDARKGLLRKADKLYEGVDPRKANKPLRGPLSGFYRITFSRYRAIYCVEEEELASGDVLVQIRVLFIIAGIRKERSREDVYKVAERIVELGLIQIDDQAEESDNN